MTNAEGKVEILYYGSWKTVCDENWYLHEARVICRMLGFNGALEAPRSAKFGHGSGDILVVVCRGTEDSLADCPSVLVVSNCRHDEDAGAVCYSGHAGGMNSFNVEERKDSIPKLYTIETTITMITVCGFYELTFHHNFSLKKI